MHCNHNLFCYMYLEGPGRLSRYSDWLRAMGWTVQGSNPGGGEIFRTRQDRPWGPPSLLYNGYRVKRPGRGADHPPPSSAEVTNEYSYTSTPPLGLRACYRAKFILPLHVSRNSFHSMKKQVILVVP
jgi:hypothetical protein